MNAAGLTSAVDGLGGTAFGWHSVWVAQRLGGWPAGRRIAAHSAGPTALWAVPPIRSLTMHLPAGPSYMPTCGGRVA